MLKLSGEAFLGARRAGIDPEFTARVAREIVTEQRRGFQIAVTVGGGNIFRGLTAAEHGMERATGDEIGMLATVMNALALQSALQRRGARVHVHSAIRMEEVAEPFIRRHALRQLQQRDIVIFAAGTGDPFFTTDMAAVLRALEMNCDVVVKGTNVDGVYTRDPKKHTSVKKLTTIRLLDAVQDPHITIVDNSALALCADHGLPVVIFNMTIPGTFRAVLQGKPVGTTMHA